MMTAEYKQNMNNNKTQLYFKAVNEFVLKMNFSINELFKWSTLFSKKKVKHKIIRIILS